MVYHKAWYGDGLTEFWYEKGQIDERSNWKNGKLDGLYEFWSNSRIKIIVFKEK